MMRLGLSGTHTLMLRLGVRLLHALRQICAISQVSGAVFAAVHRAKEKLTRVLAACKTLAEKWTAFRTLREGNKA